MVNKNTMNERLLQKIFKIVECLYFQKIYKFLNNFIYFSKKFFNFQAYFYIFKEFFKLSMKILNLKV